MMGRRSVSSTISSKTTINSCFICPQVVRNGLGDRAGTRIDPKMQAVGGKSVCIVSCQWSPEPVFLKWKGAEATADGDFFVRSGPGTVRLSPESAEGYIRTRFSAAAITKPRRQINNRAWVNHNL